MKHNEILQTLSWLHEIGVQEVTLPEPVNRFEQVRMGRKKKIDAAAQLQLPVKPTLQMPAPSTRTLVSNQQAIQNATELASNVKTLGELRDAMASFEGCDLKHTAMNLVFGDGNPDADIMLIGEAPGADEDRQGKPFVGMSGQLLDKVFAAIGLERSKIYITNMLPWRPPGNRQPTNTETAACLPFVRRHIELVNPKLLVMVGGVSSKTILDRPEGITRLRGKEITYESDGLKQPIQAMAIYHPAYLLRSPSRKQDTWYDMLRIRDMVQTV